MLNILAEHEKVYLNREKKLIENLQTEENRYNNYKRYYESSVRKPTMSADHDKTARATIKTSRGNGNNYEYQNIAVNDPGIKAYQGLNTTYQPNMGDNLNSYANPLNNSMNAIKGGHGISPMNNYYPYSYPPPLTSYPGQYALPDIIQYNQNSRPKQTKLEIPKYKARKHINKEVNAKSRENDLLLKKLFEEQNSILNSYKESASKIIKERDDYIRETNLLREKINYSRNVHLNMAQRVGNSYMDKIIEDKVYSLFNNSNGNQQIPTFVTRKISNSASPQNILNSVPKKSYKSLKASHMTFKSEHNYQVNPNEDSTLILNNQSKKVKIQNSNQRNDSLYETWRDQSSIKDEQGGSKENKEANTMSNYETTKTVTPQINQFEIKDEKESENEKFNMSMRMSKGSINRFEEIEKNNKAACDTSGHISNKDQLIEEIEDKDNQNQNNTAEENNKSQQQLVYSKKGHKSPLILKKVDFGGVTCIDKGSVKSTQKQGLFNFENSSNKINVTSEMSSPGASKKEDSKSKESLTLTMQPKNLRNSIKVDSKTRNILNADLEQKKPAFMRNSVIVKSNAQTKELFTRLSCSVELNKQTENSSSINSAGKQPYMKAAHKLSSIQNSISENYLEEGKENEEDDYSIALKSKQ